jgi:uncharacterized protein (TIRG00374 family)
MADAEKRKGKHIFLLLRILVVAVGVAWAAAWVSREQRWKNLAAIFLRMNLGIFALALAVFVVSQVTIGFRWWLLLRTQSIYISLWAAVRLHFLGLFYNNFMPSSVGGDLLRAWYVTKHTDKRFEAALSVFVDRIIGLLSTLVIAAFFYLLFMHGQTNAVTFTGQSRPLEMFAEYRRVILAVVAALAVVFCLLMLHRRGRALVQGVWSRIRIHGARAFGRLRDAIYIYCSKPLAILEVFGLTVALQILTITGFWFLGVNLGITASIKYYYVFFTLTWVLGALPVSIGGAVVVEGLLAYLFVHFAGVEAEAALALALCQRVVWMIASLPGAAIHLIGAHLPKDFSIDYDQSMA